MMKEPNNKHSKSGFWFYTLTGLSFLLSGLVLFSMVAHASEPDLGQADSSVWYAQPWVWLTGVALVIIGVVAIVKSSTKKHDQ